MNGWIKLHRSLFDNPCVTQSSDHLAIWLYLLTHATPLPYKVYFGGKEITLQPGQLITSRKTIANSVNRGVNESKVQRVLKLFENAQQIEQRACNQNRLITLINWDKYQTGEQQNEHLVNNERTTNEQRANTYREDREEKKAIHRREIPTIYSSEIAQIIAHLNSKLGTHYKPTTANTVKHISARLKEGYTVADCLTVIDSKVQEWRGTDYEKYLRPDTLFGAKFESYLNAADSSGNKQGGIAQFLDNPPTD